VAKICEQHNIYPNVFYLWKKELFSGALDTFSNRKIGKIDETKISRTAGF
jgi:transposase-like protein